MRTNEPRMFQYGSVATVAKLVSRDIIQTTQTDVHADKVLGYPELFLHCNVYFIMYVKNCLIVKCIARNNGYDCTILLDFISDTSIKLKIVTKDLLGRKS